MRRINQWLLRRMDKASPPTEPLPPRLAEMRSTVERRMSRAVMATIISTGLYAFAARFILDLEYGMLIMIPLAFLLSFVVLLLTSYHSEQAVRDYARWVARLPREPSRIVRFGVPYERKPPVADLYCDRCTAVPGQRHARRCPSVPPEWFKK